MMLIDTHCHLDLEHYDPDRDNVIQRAIQKKIKKIITIGIDLESSKKAVSLSQRYAIIYCAVGIHPNDCANLKDNALSGIRQLAKQKKVIAIGEIGLDYYRMITPKEEQKEIFQKQLQLAITLNLPVIIHNREAHEDLFNILKKKEFETLTGVLHSFSGKVSFLESILDLNFYISFTGVVTFKRNNCESLVERAPVERMLLETDSPFLTPEPFRGKRNEPAYLTYTAKKIAQVKNISLEELVKTTGKSATNLFKFSDAR
jgi:TatD DNase family protein